MQTNPIRGKGQVPYLSGQSKAVLLKDTRKDGLWIARKCMPRTLGRLALYYAEHAVVGRLSASA